MKGFVALSMSGAVRHLLSWNPQHTLPVPAWPLARLSMCIGTLCNCLRTSPTRPMSVQNIRSTVVNWLVSFESTVSPTGRGVAVSSMVTERGTSFHYVEATSVCKGCTAGVLSASGSLQVSPPVKISMSCTCSVSVPLGTCHATFLPPSAPAEV
ncbi:hypothetical protein KC19_N021400 [Ceratodon purpureus]|nr:hypothetical protein KC19_N021400 [Ceratodon purpureus]